MSSEEKGKGGASSRRVFLKVTAATIAGGGAGVAWWMTHDTPDRWEREVPFLTDVDDFYNRFDAKKREPIFWWVSLTQRDKYPMGYKASPEPWGLAIQGEVERALDLDEAEVRRRAEQVGATSYLKTLRCTGDRPDNRLSSNAVWTGTPLRPFLVRAGLKPGAVRLRIEGEDGFGANLRIADLDASTDRPALLAFAMNGEPIPHKRGGPVRLVVADRYGFKNIKWPKRIEVVAADVTWGNHEVTIRAGTDHGREAIGSKILTPDLLATNPVAETNRRDVVLRGVAFGGTSPVSKVEVRIGDGAWQPAQIAPPQELQSNPLVREAWQSLEEATWPLQGVWTPWRLPWHVPAAGEYVVRVRATNAAGEVQQEVDPRAIDGFSQQAVGTIRVS